MTNEAIAQGALYFEDKMKFCKKCEQLKDESEFYKHKLHKDGLSSNCKTCINIKVSEYQKTETGKQARIKAISKYKKSYKGKSTNKKYNSSMKGKENYRRGQIKYRASENGSKKIKEYKHSEEGLQQSKKYRINNPIQTKARAVVTNAVASGNLPHVSNYTCKCGKVAQEYHHWSYKKEHWLSVVPMCIQCHAKLHRESYQ